MQRLRHPLAPRDRHPPRARQQHLPGHVLHLLTRQSLCVPVSSSLFLLARITEVVQLRADTGSLLATLNARSPHAEGSFTDRFPSRTGHASSFSPSTSSRLKGFGTPAGPPVQVSVRQEMHIEAERGDDEEVLGLEGVKRKKEGGAGGGEVVKVQFAGAGERKGADKAGEGDSDEF